MRTRLPLLAAALLVLPLAGCFDPPVREAIHLLFDGRGRLEVSMTTRLEAEGLYERNPKAKERIAEARDAARCGEDPFTRQLERLSPTSFRRSLLWRDGNLREIARVAAFDEPRAVERLFEAYPLSVSLSKTDEAMQLEILPGSAGRAAPSERREVMEALDRFSNAGARYLGTLGELWEYLDANPARERPVVSELLGIKDLSTEGEDASSARETALLEAVGDAMQAVHKFLELEEGRSESLDELSRKVFDPFPATVSIEVAGKIDEVTGLSREGERRLLVPAVSLTGALTALSGHWVSPDPIAVFLAAAEGPDLGPADLDAFLAHRRFVGRRPTAAELREAVERALAPRPFYRLRWTLPRPGVRP